MTIQAKSAQTFVKQIMTCNENLPKRRDKSLNILKKNICDALGNVNRQKVLRCEQPRTMLTGMGLFWTKYRQGLACLPWPSG